MRKEWEIKKLGELCEMYQPKTISKKEMVDDGAYPVFGANGIIGKYHKYNHESPQLLITCRGATCGSVNISRPKSWINGNAMVVRPKDNTIDLNYLEYLFRGGINLSETISGAAQPQITRKSLKPLEISYPNSLTEQKQIVKLLDQAFEAIDQAKANIKKNIANAKELFQSKLNEVFSQKGEGWEEKTFKEVCILQRGFDLPKRLRQQGDYPLISSSGVIDTHSEARVKGPGVVTGRSGSIGNLFFIKDDFWPLNTTLYIKDFKENLEEYVYYFIKQFNLKRFSSGSGVPTLNRNFVHDEIVCSTDNLKVQKQIINQLNQLTIKTQKIQSKYNQKLTSLEELKKSILQKAFSGELTNPN